MQLDIYKSTDVIQEVKLDKVIQNFLERNYYENYNISTQNIDIEENKAIDFIKINHISYDRNKDETDINLIDFQQILGAISSKTKKFVYVIESNNNGIDLYLGTLKDSQEFLNNTFQGIYSGSEINFDKPKFEDSKYSKAMLGIPSLKRDSDKKYNQSLEKILFPMQNKNFRIVVVAESYDNNTIKEIISNYQTLGSELHRFVKQSKNIQESNSQGTSHTKGSSNSKTQSDSYSSSESISDKTLGSKIGNVGSFVGGAVIGASIGSIIPGPGTAIGAAIGGGITFIGSQFFSKTKSESTSQSHSESRTNSTNESFGTNENKTKTLGITFDEINKSAEYCENLIDKYIERFQKGLNHGMWNTSLYIQSNDETTLSELEHTLKSVYSGDETYFEAIRFSENLNDNKNIKIENLPMLYFDKSFKHPIHSSFSGFSSAINSEELSILSALPNNDIDGISVSKVSSFGLTQAKIDKYNSIEIGNVLNKKKSTNQKFKLSLDGLNSHLFVSGITGGGKSNTIKGILENLQNNTNLENKIPFLVIEPAKSEYKHLLKKIPNLQIFRPGAKGDIFRFNPFIFEHSRKNNSVTLTKHVDMLKTTFCSAFPMYGPMPYILEEAIHKVYEKKGWSFETEDHPYYTDSKDANYDRKSLLFPNMEDLKEEVIQVVENAGYYQDLQNNIKAALKTRINNLTLGVKGKIFNSRHSFDSELLFETPTIIELSNIVDDEEKAFLMGLILNKLYSYKEEKGQSKSLNHITVIEEAHRLLPNISLDKSGEEASSRAKSIETFTNILAEIRAYGEGIIIADQIASKLHRDVIKNTNIKIIHRTMDYEDREIVGKAINLSDEQILDIAELKSGEAIVHNRDIHQAFMVKIDEFKEEKISDDEIKNFYKRFIEKNEEYKYEFLFEKWFYVENRPEINSLDFDRLKLKLVEFINSILFDSKNILENWENLKKDIGKRDDDKEYIYILNKLWNKLNYLSNMQFYRNIDCYIDSIKGFTTLILTIIEKKDNNLENRVDNFKKCFEHLSLKTIYPSMKNYKDFEIDFTLLFLENITSDEEIYEFVNTTMKEDISLNDRLDKISQKIFKTTNPQLRHSLGAIRSGKKEIDFTNIIKEGF
ncbi:ATP-binding protein [Arcobacter porcinus]|uniref:ATP-binding protein, HerA family (DUF87 domain) n=1 Tax=Arcobacter porcinus TaxID=1935204 RepID=A0A5C2HA26_9BACT|nr:DUF87 domain-containing protein [Arcobacter porcinus]OCL97194.1 AAA-like domain protein [Aliarcobacter thereius]QEP39806.1 ATP-binding protein, HerA family (DUF87 domain) [Arcobacter porcinus]